MQWKPKFSIAIPASLVSDTPHLREKTTKIGMVGRAAAIFRVEEIIIYRDKTDIDQSKDERFIQKILLYMETPQYLRKKLFKIEPDLRYVGILPPLRTPHHPIEGKTKKLRKGEFREGIVTKTTKRGTYAYIGVEKQVFIPKLKIPKGKRVTVKIVRVNGKIEAKLVKREEINVYWGYTVKTANFSLKRLVKGRDWDLKIATSKYGTLITKVIPQLAEKWNEAKNKLVIFGSPTEGLYEIAEREGINLDENVDFVINTIPDQGTETVRTEEAIYASLATLNILNKLEVK